MKRNIKALSAMFALVLLTSCGGGSQDNPATAGNAGDGSSAAPGAGGTTMPTFYTSEGRALSTCSLIPACSGVPTAPFFAYASSVPPSGATLNGIVRLALNGNEMANVELLPASGYTPRIGVFKTTGDQTQAWMDLDTTALPNGPVTLRISAFNVPAGQGGTEIIAMPARTWVIDNPPATPSAFTAVLAAAPLDGAVLNGIVHLELRGSAIANAELLPATGYTPRLGVFNVSADRTIAWLDFDTRSLPDGVQNLRISAFNTTEGQPNATEIVAMPARAWSFANGLTSTANGAPSTFTATVTLAPVHGEIVSGRTRLEVRGTGIQNVELLPASGYTPKLGTFSLSGDGKFAWLDFNTADLPNGLLSARISAFNTPAGQPGAQEIIAMPARDWILKN